VVIELQDTIDVVVHNKFHWWRKRNPLGMFLALTTKTKANLHGASCHHTGTRKWSMGDSSSLTKKRKVLEDGPGSLQLWASERGIEIHVCHDCQRNGYIISQTDGAPGRVQEPVQDQSDDAREDRAVLSRTDIRPTKRKARSYTQYWKNESWGPDVNNGVVDHAVSNNFIARGVQPGDRLYIVTNIKGTLFLGNVLLVDRIVGQEAGQKYSGGNVWEGKDHALAVVGQPLYKDLCVPPETVKALRFDGDKALAFNKAGELDSQTLRGVRLLTDQSADRLQALLDARLNTKPPEERNLSDSPLLYSDERALESQILNRLDLSETDKQVLIKTRRGQGLFRDRVAALAGNCRVTLVSDLDHLNASHIKPWRDSSNEERLSENNGLMLAPHIDHLFDRGYISFTDDGELLVSSKCSAEILEAWGVSAAHNAGPFRALQRPFLAYHREHCFKA
jgi:hypothetical protein